MIVGARRRLATVRSSWVATITAGVVTTLAVVASAGPPALQPPSPEALADARAIVAAMKRAPRGPYKQIRWFCSDGSVHPPTPYPCRERGGGSQHAEYSDDRVRLATLGWSVGTIVQALKWDELWDVAHRHQRLRELPIERYLIDVDDGWVLRRAMFYRGRVQVEDEEEAGYRLLIPLLSSADWLATNYLLGREAVRTLPHHGGGGDRTRTVRRLAKELSDRESRFEDLRVKIHTRPDGADAATVRAWAKNNRDVSSECVTAARQLADEIDLLFGDEGRARRLESARRILLDKHQDELALLLADAGALRPAVRVQRLAALLAGIRDRAASSNDGVLNLLLLDLSVDAETELIASAGSAFEAATTRADLVSLARALLDAGYGAGLLSAREREAQASPLRAMVGQSRVVTAEWLAATRGLERVSGWAAATVRYVFAEPLVRYVALEPAADHFVDDLLRGSALLPLARVANVLARDAERLAGLTHRVFGESVGGLAGLNPGAALGKLRIVTSAEIAGGARLSEDEIVVLPQTVSELTPVAGIISLDEGNVLSHVQLLARNLGIPNANLTPTQLTTLNAHAGRDVLLAVSHDGSVVLAAIDEVPVELRTRIRPEIPNRTGIDAPIPDLTVERLLPLGELHAKLSGKVVGPKAANLGELARQFPGRVELALALPFGVFASHASAAATAPKARLDRAFADYRAGTISLVERDREIEAVRAAVANIVLAPETHAALDALLGELFGPPGTYGVFIRSDTNCEDLPEFTGAGLNETLANVRGSEAIRRGIARVWSSPFAPRAIAWRSRILNRPEEVYPSVLVMKSVPADKSGVLVTTDLATGGDGLTVAIAWGVGGAVDGDSAESLRLLPDGTEVLVREAKAPYRRVLSAEGGTEWAPATIGSVLKSDEIAQLRAFADEVGERLTPAIGPDGGALPWDVEFGFVNGRLTLFQVRPLVMRGEELASAVVRAFAGPPRSITATVDLTQSVSSEAIDEPNP